MCSTFWDPQHRGSFMVKLFQLSLANFLLTTVAFGNLIHYDEPQLIWKIDVLGTPGRISTPGFVRNNAIITSTDGSSLYMTMDDGSLVVVDANEGKTLSIYKPPMLDDGSFTSNDGSGVALSSDGKDNIVYAVHDSPLAARWNGTFWYDIDPWYAEDRYNDSATISSSFPADVRANPYTQPDQEQSRIISLDASGAFRWSYEIEGVVVGTPSFGSFQSAELVYVLHNVDNIGRITILEAKSILEDDSSSSLFPSSRHYNVSTLFHEVSTYDRPYSPFTLISDNGPNASNNDILYWAETRSDLPGHDRRGKFHRVTITPSLEVKTKQGRSEYTGTPTQPVVSHNHSDIYIMGRRSTVSLMDFDPNPDGTGGWWRGSIKLPIWAVHVDLAERNMTAPLRVAGTLSHDDNRMYVPGGNTALFCLNVTNGTALWEYDTQVSNYDAQLRVSRDDKVVYSISTRSGLVMAQDALSGEVIWELDCRHFENSHQDCQDAVEAEFALSPDGTHLYYGDIFGSVTALKVGEIDILAAPPSHTPSIAPTENPSAIPSEVPSIKPSAGPTAKPTGTPSSMPSIQPSSEPTGLPTDAPSPVPSELPSAVPSHVPSEQPTRKPTLPPTSQPSDLPSLPHTSAPSNLPSQSPSNVPTKTPSDSPTRTQAPTHLPTESLAPSTILPTKSLRPSEKPTHPPTSSPSVSAAPSTSEAPTQQQQTRFSSSAGASNLVSPTTHTALLSAGAIVAVCGAAVATILGYRAYKSRASSGGTGEANSNTMEDADGYAF